MFGIKIPKVDYDMVLWIAVGVILVASILGKQVAFLLLAIALVVFGYIYRDKI